MFDVIKEILISEKEFTETKLEDINGGMYLTADSLIQKITSSNITTLGKVNVKSHGSDKMYMNKELIEDKLYQTIDQFNKRKITSTKLYLILLNKIYQFYDGNGRTCLLLMI